MNIAFMVLLFIAGVANLIIGDISRFSYALVWIALMFNLALYYFKKADAAEVKHGEWIEDGYYDNPCVCSYCGTEAHLSSFNVETFDYDWEENLQSTGYEEIREYIRTPYCPNCGAKMDGKEKEDVD